jgi:ligand-binding sensor domain-containing protein/serine phosphatase RsbU (regulator of sigma subunit)
MPRFFLKIFFSVIFTVMFSLCSLKTTFSQTYYLENYSVRQGLPNSKVYDMVQDKGGYIWLATPSGLCRFDGENFDTYGLDFGLDESSVRALYLDQDDRLWVGFENGKAFVQMQDTFQLVLSNEVNSIGEISDITQKADGDILVSTSNDGLYYIESPLESNQDIIHFTGKDGVDSQIFKMESLSDGSVLFVTSVDLQLMDSDSLKVEYFRPYGFPSFFPSTYTFEDKDGNIWIGKFNGGLYRYIRSTEEFKFFDIRDGLVKNFISTIYIDSKNRIWAGTWGGGISLIENDHVIANFDQSNGLEGLNIHKIMEDSEGNIYFASHENGFFVFKGNQFLSLSEDNGLPNQQIWDICGINDSVVLLATNNGVAEVHFSSPIQAKVSRIHTKTNNGLISNSIRKLVNDQKGKIWIATHLSGIQSYDFRTREFDYNFVLNSNLPKNAKVIGGLEVIGNDLYVASVDGLINHEISTGKNQILTQTSCLSGNDIETLYKGRNDKLWIGVRNGGINSIDKDFNIYAYTKTKDITPICFTENVDGDLWVGTFKGVFKLVNDSLIGVIDENSGLMSNYVSLLHFLDEDRLIIGSNNGLNIYHLSTGEIIHYNKNVGYTGIETKTNSYLDRGNGSILFGTTGGLMIFNSLVEEREPKEPYVHITRMRVNMEDRTMDQTETYRYNENSFLFNYHAISLSNQFDLKYQVRLDGLDQNWREPTQAQSISFSQLSPGKYTLKIKAITFDGVENETPAEYSFTIRPPFWRTWWFISLSLFIIIASTFFGVRYRIYLLKKEKKILEQKVADRTKEISLKNEQLAEKNKHITDSINYARRIQYATMRPEEQLYMLYEKAFILYIPKDIVSGDFYWYAKKGKSLIIAAADCTGHGVPGAFMSMLGIAYLNEIVGRMNKIVASEILERLRANVIGALNQSDAADTTKDGMDIALVILDTETNQIQFSGAYNPLYILRNSELIEFKGDRMPIGIHSRDSEKFTNHQTQLEEGDQLYFFTDGYADQFGGPKGKKMNYKRFKNHLQEHSELSPMEQKDQLLEAFQNWKGEHEQLDDVLVISLKI